MLLIEHHMLRIWTYWNCGEIWRRTPTYFRIYVFKLGEEADQDNHHILNITGSESIAVILYSEQQVSANIHCTGANSLETNCAAEKKENIWF